MQHLCCLNEELLIDGWYSCGDRTFMMMNYYPLIIDLPENVSDSYLSFSRVGRLVFITQVVAGNRCISPAINIWVADLKGEGAAGLHLLLVVVVEFSSLFFTANELGGEDIPYRGVRMHVDFNATGIMVREGCENALDNRCYFVTYGIVFGHVCPLVAGFFVLAGFLNLNVALGLVPGQAADQSKGSCLVYILLTFSSK